jgi:hypothetical protein
MAVSTSFSGKIHQILQNESQHIVQWNESVVSPFALSTTVDSSGRLYRSIFAVRSLFARCFHPRANSSATHPYIVLQIARHHLFSGSCICMGSEGSGVERTKDPMFTQYSSEASGRR